MRTERHTKLITQRRMMNELVGIKYSRNIYPKTTRALVKPSTDGGRITKRDNFVSTLLHIFQEQTSGEAASNHLYTFTLTC